MNGTISYHRASLEVNKLVLSYVMCTTILKALQGQALMTAYITQYTVPYMAKSLNHRSIITYTSYNTYSHLR